LVNNNNNNKVLLERYGTQQSLRINHISVLLLRGVDSVWKPQRPGIIQHTPGDRGRILFNGKDVASKARLQIPKFVPKVVIVRQDAVQKTFDGSLQQRSGSKKAILSGLASNRG
jgi:hypothetical protein